MAAIGEKDRQKIELATAVMLLGILLIIHSQSGHHDTAAADHRYLSGDAQRRDVCDGSDLRAGHFRPDQLCSCTAIMAGAGTDYAVFLDQPLPRLSADGRGSPTSAVRNALTSVGKVITASAATVAVTFLAMIFTKLGVFSTVGMRWRSAIAVAFLARA